MIPADVLSIGLARSYKFDRKTTKNPEFIAQDFAFLMILLMLQTSIYKAELNSNFEYLKSKLS